MDDKKRLYDRLTSVGVNLGTYDEYDKNISNPEKAVKLYDRLTSAGFEMGDFGEYMTRIGHGKRDGSGADLGGGYTSSNARGGDEVGWQTGSGHAGYNATGGYAGDGGVRVNPVTGQVIGGGSLATQKPSGKVYLGEGSSLSPTLNEESVSERKREEEERKREKEEQLREEEEQRALMKQHLSDSGQIDRIKQLRDEAQQRIDDNPDKVSWADRALGMTNIFSGTQVALKELKNLFGKGDMAADQRIVKNADRALEMIDEAGHADKGFLDKQIGGVFRGLADSATDSDTWDFGLGGMSEGVAMKRILDKREKGEELTPSEEGMLTMLGLNAYVQEVYGEDVGMGYNVGKSLPESAGFMAQMYLNPIGGLGKKAAEYVGKRTLKNLAEKGVERGMRRVLTKGAAGGARVLGDMVEMAGTTLVPGAGRVYEDYLNRSLGEAGYTIDEEGNVVYDGQHGQEEDNALAKAIGSNYIENWSEAIGEYFAPIGKGAKSLLKGATGKKAADAATDAAADATGRAAGRTAGEAADAARRAAGAAGTGAGASGASAAGEATNSLFDRIMGTSSKQIAKSMDDFRKKVKFDGLVGEYMEEVVGNVINAATVGDNNFSVDPSSEEWNNSVFNPEMNAETFLSCALMSGTMYAVETGAKYTGDRLEKRRVRRHIEDNKSFWENRCSELLGDNWKEAKAGIDSAEPGDLVDYVNNVRNSKTLSDDEKRALSNYAYYLMQMQAFNTRKVQDVENMTPEERMAEAEDERESQAEDVAMSQSSLEEARASLDGKDQSLREQLETLLTDDASDGEINAVLAGLDSETSMSARGFIDAWKRSKRAEENNVELRQQKQQALYEAERKQRRAAYRELQRARRNAEMLFGRNTDIEHIAREQREEAMSKMDAQHRSAAQRLFKAKDETDMLFDEFRQAVDKASGQAMEQASADYDRLHNADSQRMTQVTINGADGPVWITSGNVTFDKDGRADTSQSDDMITAMDADGNVQMYSPAMITSLVSDVEREEYINSAVSQAESEAYDRLEAELESPDLPAPEKGGHFFGKDADGNSVRYLITGVNGDQVKGVKLNEDGTAIDEASPSEESIYIEEYYSRKEDELWPENEPYDGGGTGGAIDGAEQNGNGENVGGDSGNGESDAEAYQEGVDYLSAIPKHQERGRDGKLREVYDWESAPVGGTRNGLMQVLGGDTSKVDALIEQQVSRLEKERSQLDKKMSKLDESADISNIVAIEEQRKALQEEKNDLDGRIGYWNQVRSSVRGAGTSEATDYDSLLERDPMAFYQAYGGEFGTEEANNVLAAKRDEYYREAEKRATQAAKETSPTRRAAILREAKELQRKGDELRNLVANWKNKPILPKKEEQDAQERREINIFAEAEEEARRQQEIVSGRTEEEQRAAQEAAQRRIDEEQAQREAGTNPAQRKARRFSEEEDRLDAAMSVREFVAREIATGRATFRWDDRGDTKGLGAHTANGEAERRRRIWSLNNKEGERPEVVAERIHEMLPDGLREQVTSMDVLDIINELMTEYNSPSEMWDKEVRQPNAQMNNEELMPGYEEYDTQMRLEWEAEKNGMSVEDWQSYNEYVEEQMSSLPSQEEIDNEITLNVNNYGDRRTEREVPAVDAGQGAQAAGVDLGTGERGNPQGAALEQGAAGAQAGLREGTAMVRQGDAEAGGTGVRADERGGQGNIENPSGRQQGTLETESINVTLSDEKDNNGIQFVLSKEGEEDFGFINDAQARGISTNVAAPIRLSYGNEGYGYVHMQKHVDQLKKNGYDSVEDFVKDVASGKNEIRQGNVYLNESTGEAKETYLLVKKGEKGSVLYVELVPDGEYYTVNSGGVFKNSYIEKRKELWSASTEHSAASGEPQDFPLAQQNPESDNVSALSQSTSSADKGNALVGEKQENSQEKPTISAKKASYDTDTGQFEGVDGYVPSANNGNKNNENIRNNGVNGLPLQPEITSVNNERREVERLARRSQEVNRANAAESTLRRGGNRASAQGERGSWNLRSLLGDVLRRSKGGEAWIDDVKSITQKKIGHGGENEAYLSKDGRSVIKVNDFSYMPEDSENFDSFFNRVEAHNELFPSVPITIIGLTESSDGRLGVVTSQPYIVKARDAKQEEIDAFLEDMGFYTDMSGNWTDGVYEIADTKPGNVVVDANGVLHFIDAIPFDSRKPGKMLEIPKKKPANKKQHPASTQQPTETQQRIDAARGEVNTAPTEGQKDAGNSTVFGRRDNANLPRNEEVVYRSKEITPEQSSLLERPNSAQYPTAQELLDVDKVNVSSGNMQGSSDIYATENNPSGNKLVSDERYQELLKRMRSKLGGQLNVGIDPELLAIGTEMAVYHIEKGARKFMAYAKGMISDIGDVVRPYLKAFYNGARDLPGMEEYAKEMTPYEEVSKIDVASIGKQASMLDMAEQVAREQEVKAQVEEVKKKSSSRKKKTNENDSAQGDLFAEEESARADKQGNPIGEDGKLLIENVASVDEISDEDFTNPTRNIGLPPIPKNIDEAIGAGGKQVVIKKNMLERNKERHSDISPKDSRAIIKSALYNPDLYGQNQKAKRPYNWVVINTKDESGRNRLVLLEVNNNKDNVEIVHWYYLRNESLETMRRQAEREGGLILILPSESSEEAGGLSSRTPSLPSADKGNKSTAKKQAEGQKNEPTNGESDKMQRFYVEYVGDMLQLRRERVVPNSTPVADARPVARANSAHEMLDILNNPANRFGKELDSVRKALKEEIEATSGKKDKQGNPVDADGKLIVERINSIDELTDEDFTNPTRNVELPKLPKNVDAAIGADGRPVIIKKNIFEKNWGSHKFSTEESRRILRDALYNTDLYGRTQPNSKPNNWVVIKIDDKSPITVLEVNSNKDNIEVVGWYTLDERNLERIRRQAERNGSELVVLSPNDKVESFPTPMPSLSSESKGTQSASNTQVSGEENGGENVSLQGDTGEQAATQRGSAMTNFSDTVAKWMLNALHSGEKPFRSIVELRFLARECGMEVSDEGRTDILIQELVEDGLVNAARKLVEKARRKAVFGRGKSFFPVELYEQICRLYDMQPTIGQRSSNRIKMQQYSTPLPMAFVADMFVDEKGKITGDERILEPTAGNGMLVFAVPSAKLHVNELDDTRYENLRFGGYYLATKQDATQPFEGGRSYAGVISNPPFGKAGPKLYDGTEIASLEAQIALNALESMKDDGRAAIIVGGNMEYQPNGAIKGADRAFYTYLYDHYNVRGVVDMDGSLYRKQGTTYPTRMILIEGRRSDEERAQETVYPPVRDKAIPKAQSFEELYDIVNGLLNSKEKTNGTAVLRREQGLGPDPESRPGNGNDRPNHQQPKKDDREPGRGGRGGAQLSGGESQGGESVLGERGRDSGTGGTGRGVGEAGRGNERNAGGGVLAQDDKRVGDGALGQRGVGLSSPTDKTADKTADKAVADRNPVERKRSLTDEKTAYRPHSRAFSLESVAPAAMTDAMDDALRRIEAEVGDIDTFVQTELGYDSVEALHNALAAEQVDSVAMAIYQMTHGEAMIIGDQTGVGKGRQMAALIRWAVKKGKKPVFITQKADLFSDLYRDLVDIGSGELRPFIFNQDGDIKDAKNETVYKPLSGEKMKKVLRGDKLPEGYDFVVLTYSQLNKGDSQSKKEAYEQAKKSGKRVQKKKEEESNAPSPKPDYLRKLAKGNVLLLDESHTAAGDGNTGMYLQSIMRDAEAATFASATFAKRPDTMPLYAIRTAMSKANVEANKLIEIIEKGGVTLQEIMSRALSAVGQMVRRERDMSDVKTDWKTVDDKATVERARSNYDRTVKAFNAIIKFQNDYVKPYIDELSAQLAMQMKSAEQRKGTKDLGLTNVPFASKAYNYTKQLLLALKVDAIVDEVEREIKAGRHPVIALESTMESVLDGYNAGDVLENATFGASLMKGLENTLSYTVKDSKNKEEKHKIPLSMLPESARQAYEEVKRLILESTREVYVSPIDDIISKLNARGYSVGELTGRDKYVSMEDGRAVVRKRADKDKKRMTMDFNAGRTDVLILNKSASTGISLHASSRFGDQRQRTMVMAQPLSDINDYMQMIGRIDRTGQVHRGYYINLGLPVPAENRFMMMLSTKLKSLNANTTTSQDSKQNDVEAPDLLNKYGSQVVVEYLRDHPDIYEKMGDPLKLGEDKTLDDYRPEEDDARKVTGYVALLSVEEQEAFYNEVVERYNTLITQLNETDSNDLKISVMPLKAKTLSKKVATKGNDPAGMNPFAKDSYVEEVEMDVLRKPWKMAEVRKMFDALQRGMKPHERVIQLIDRLVEETDRRRAAENARHEAALAGVDKEVEVRTDKIRNQKKLSEEEKRKAIEEERKKILIKVGSVHEKNLKLIDDQAEKMRSALTRFNAGSPYLIPDVLGTDVFSCSTPGMLIGFKVKDEGMTPSTSFAVFAVLDGRRKVEVKLSDTKALDAIRNHTMQNYDRASELTVNNWDSQIPQTTRTKGFLLTGNIIQAVSDSQGREGGFAGKLVSYTDENGDIHDGILMPQAWTPSLMKSAGVPINAVQKRIESGDEVRSIDGDVSVHRMSRWSSAYVIRVPKSRKKGGQYFLNDELLGLVDRDGFTQRGDAMAAYVDEKHLKQALDVLSKLGVRVDDASKDGGVKMQRAMGGSVSYDLTQEAELRDALVERLRGAGIEVVTDAEVGQRVLDEEGRVSDAVRMSKKRALETAYSSQSEVSLTVISSADGANTGAATIAGTDTANPATGTPGLKDAANIADNLESVANSYEKSSNRTRGFITDLSRALGLRQHGASNYGSFILPDGSVLSLRVSNHNAKVSNFDANDELNGLSIVISKHANKGLVNDGTAHITEYFYSKRDLEASTGKPLAEIARSIKSALATGEFTDTTGLAERQEVNGSDVRYFRSGNGEVYGFTKGGRIYLDPKKVNAETPIHEYAHLWAEALRKRNPEEWKNVVELMKDSPVWDEVKSYYPELETDDELAEEVLAMYSGRRGAERLREMQRESTKERVKSVVERVNAVAALERVKDALKRFWKNVAEFFNIHYTSAEEVADRVLYDLLDGVNPVDDIETINSKFNEDIDRYTNRGLPSGYRFELGYPSGYLLSAGFENLPISMRSSLLSRKAGDERHPFVASELKDLVKKLQKPIAVFKYSKDNMRNLIVDTQSNGKHFLVGVTLNYNANGIEINSVSGLFPKESHEWIKWIQDGKAIRIDEKEKVLSLIDSLRTNPAESERIGLNLDSATKVVKEFENPSVEGENTTIRYQFVGKRGAMNADRADESIVRIDNLHTARKMEKAGKGAAMGESLEEVNRRFNEELDSQINGTLGSGHIYQLGLPSSILKSTGIPDLPIQMSATRLEDKAKKYGHDFSLGEVKNLVKTLQEPIAVFAYGDKDKAQNIIVEIQKDGKNFVVGLSIRPIVNGRVLDINSIRNVFPKNNAEWLNWISQGKSLYLNKEKIQTLIDQQRTILADVDYLDLDSIAKVVKEFENPSVEGEKISDEEDLLFRVREEEAPEKTGIGYKVFVLKGGQLYPPMVANPNGAATPVGVWLDADAAPIAGESKTGRKQVKAGGKGTQGGSGKLAYRPGWHLGEMPYALQFNRLNPETGERELFPKDFVWAEVEYADDVDYQEEAMSYGYNANGKFQHSLAGLPKLPVNGSYKYRTNPNPETDEWVITGAMKVNRILKPSEVDEMVREAGREPQRRQEGAVTDAEVEQLNVHLMVGSIEEVNRRFNEELGRLNEDNAQSVILNIGNPGEILRSAGISDMPIRLYGNKLLKKMRKHGFEASDVKDLPMAINNPIAVFNNYGNERNRAVLTELKTSQGNILATIEWGKGTDAEINIVTSVFGKGKSNIIDWINKGFATYINKRKALDYLRISAPIAEAQDNQELSDATKVVKDFENPSVEGEKMREGEGGYTDESISYENDPVSKWMGVSRYGTRQQKAYAERVRRQMREQVASMGKALGVEIEIVDSGSELSGRKSSAKGWFNPRTGKVTVVLGNHSSVQDVMKTVLHESVAHYGLRKLFKQHFDDFLDNVFANASVEVRYEIMRLAGKHGYNIRTATEEYLAGLAEETDFNSMDSWFGKIQHFFIRMLAKAGIELNIRLTDNELRYILWRSYQNLANPGYYRDVVEEVKDVAMQAKLEARNQSRESKELRRLLGTGRIDLSGMVSEEDGLLYREVDDAVSLFGSTHEGAARTEVVRSLSDLERYAYDNRSGYTPDELEEVYNNANAVYDPKGDCTLIFASDGGERETNAYLWHENSHRAIRRLGIGGDALNAVYRWIDERMHEECESLRRYYPEEEFGEECVTKLIESLYYRLGEEGMLERISGVKNEAVKETLLSIYNYVKYGREEGTDRRGAARGRGASVDVRGGSAMGMRDTDAAQAGAGTRFQRAATGAGGVTPSVDHLHKVAAMDEYERSMKGFSYKAQEAFQDCMLGLKKLQDALAKASGKPVKDYENAYLFEDHLSSINDREVEAFNKHFFHPILKAMGALMKRGVSEQGIYDYLMAKHGIERNREMAVMKALREDENTYDTFMEHWRNEKKLITQDASLSWSEQQRKLDDLAMTFGADLERDYSGFEEMFAGNGDYADKKREAWQMVVDFESAHPEEAQALREKVSAANKAILDKQRESGLMSREQYERWSEMYQYYVPLRGFDDTVSDDVYSYFGGDKNTFNAPQKRAKGRISKADNPIAYIGNMAASGIAQGNKNLMKQKLLMFVKSRPSDLVSVGDLWVRYDASSGEWVSEFPVTNPDDSPSVVQQKLEAFEENMRQAAAQHPDLFAKVKDRPELKYRVLGNKINEHQIVVKVNGKPVVMTINGNPKAAQAINGLMNPVSTDGFFSRLESVNRFMAANFTKNNPAFVVTNLVRDGIYANSMVWVKESPKYAMAYHKNWLKTEAEIYGLVTRYKSGKLDMNNPVDKMFSDFILNGGETGYNFIRGVDSYKKQIERAMKRIDGSRLSQSLDLVREGIDTFNRFAEDVSRFAAYRTSIEQGRSILRAIEDAKEISVNFNRRGAGAKSGGLVGTLAQYCRGFYIFFNAGVQGMYNFVRNAKHHPGKFAALCGSFMGLGAMMPLLSVSLGLLLGGDDDDYWDIPEYTRRNNICILIGGGKYVCIPLPIELRSLYGIGEMATSVLVGREPFDGMKLAKQVSQILPVDPLEGNDNFWSNLAPSYSKPIIESISNKSWTGIPIYKDTPYNKQMPEWTKAYKGTSPYLVSLSESLNSATGGNKYKKGWLDVNPAVIEHLMQGYAGGVGTTINQSIKSIMLMSGNEEIDGVNQVPVLSRFLKESSDRTKRSSLNNRYYRMQGCYEETKRQYRNYLKEVNNEQSEERDKYLGLLDELSKEKEFVYMENFFEAKKQLDKLLDYYRETGDKDAEDLAYQLKQEMLDAFGGD